MAFGAQGQTFEWRDERGTTRSEHELAPTSMLTELRVREGTAALTALERRTLEIINEAARADREALARANPTLMPPASASPTGPEAPVAAPQSAASENVKDPCLLSWDPQCVEKHAADYDPRWGYAPSRIRSAGRSDEPTTTAEHRP